MEEVKKVMFTETATASGGREGKVKSEKGTIDYDVLMPMAENYQSGKHTNPEELFAGAYASCFDGAIRAVAENGDVKIDDSETTVEVSFGKTGDGFGLSAKIRSAIHGVDEATAKDLLEKAHQICPYSKATRGNIHVDVGLA